MKKLMSVIVSGVVAALCAVPAFTCHHDVTFTSVTVEPTCIVAGHEDVVCADCGVILESREIAARGHAYGEYTVVREPDANGNGLKVRVCGICSEEDEEEVCCDHSVTTVFRVRESTCKEPGREIVICEDCDATVESYNLETLPHETTSVVVVKESSCYESGLEQVICEDCGSVVEEHELPLAECTYGDWIYTEYATPFEAGERYRECSVCAKVDTESYTVEMKENSIYIPGTGINHNIAVNYYTQAAVNGNDIVYTERAYAKQDPNNPFVLGHDYGTLGNLHKTEVGQKIYLYVNGEIETYEVIYSEYAVEDYAGVQIVGQTSGVNIWDTLNSDLPSDYAVYGSAHGGENLRDTVNEGKTLHMFTCHKGEPCQPSDGRRGRWIVLATAI